MHGSPAEKCVQLTWKDNKMFDSRREKAFKNLTLLEYTCIENSLSKMNTSPFLSPSYLQDFKFMNASAAAKTSKRIDSSSCSATVNLDMYSDDT
jgi:hypothetical protein